MFWKQVVALLKKNIVLSKRNVYSTALRVGVPLLFLASCYLLTANIYGRPTLKPTTPIGSISKCQGPKCESTLVYAPNSTVTYTLMAALGRANNPPLIMGKDIVITNLSYLDFQMYMINEAPQSTQGGIFFLNDGEEDISYMTVYNESLYGLEKSNRLEIMFALERAILLTSANTELKVGILDYPSYNSSSSYFHYAMQMVVLVMVYIALTIALFSLMSSIGSERERFIPGYLKCFGLKDGVYNISYFVFHMSQHMILSLIIIIVSYSIPGLHYFQRTNVFVHFLNFFCFGIGMFGQSILFAVLVRSALGGNIVAAFMFFFGLGFALFVTFTGGLVYGWWDPTLSFGARIFLYIFYLFPFFHYVKASADIANHAVGYLDDYYNVVYTKGFSIHDLLKSPAPEQSVETTLTSMLFCLSLGIVYFLIASYLDLVLYDNQGARKSLFFFLKLSYWRSSTSPSNQSKHGIVVNNLSKRYGRGSLIVSDVSFQAFDGSVVVLLGRNGAGKSTIMNVLIGLTSPSRGTAIIKGYDIVRDTAKIQSTAGVCLQNDIFWPELTAKEHLTIVCALKGITNIDEEVNSKLREVKLSKVANGQVQTFSGGMKRRLSVAMSMVGDPKIIMLDEPTTGIDVMNQKFLWEAINNLKRKGTLVLLITHSDEEASAVGDKIVLLYDGKIRAEGTPAKIQEQFRINTVSVLVDVSKSADIKSEISTLLPDATILAENAGSIVFGFSNAAQAPDLVSFLQQDASIKDWKISNSSIDTAFLVGTQNNIN